MARAERQPRDGVVQDAFQDASGSERGAATWTAARQQGRGEVEDNTEAGAEEEDGPEEGVI